jgi:hypothetical protein
MSEKEGEEEGGMMVPGLGWVLLAGEVVRKGRETGGGTG